MNISQTSITQKRIRARQAIIADDDDDNDDIEIINEQPTKSESKLDSMDAGANQEHLGMMKKIEDLRLEHGDGWLQSQSATEVLDMMGIPIKSPTWSSMKASKTQEQFLNELCGDNASLNIDHRTSTPVQDFDRAISPSVVSGMSFTFSQNVDNFINPLK